MQLPNRLVNEWALPVRRRLTGDVFRSAERVRAHIDAGLRKPADHRPPRYLSWTVRVRSTRWNEWPVYEVSPRGEEAGARIVYLHGGAYMDEITRWHWHLIAEVVRGAGMPCFVPIYPLIPRTTAAELVTQASDYLAAVLGDRQDRPTVLMGDSAGAGLALASCLALRDRGARQPLHLVLFSPFLDVSVSDERQRPLEPKDKLLRPPGLAEAGRIYAGSLPLDDPRVSPVFGDLRDLPPMTVFTGTHDILDIDSRRLAERAAESGIPLDLRERPGAPHAYAVFPTAQGAAARREVAAICRRVAKKTDPAQRAAG